MKNKYKKYYTSLKWFHPFEVVGTRDYGEYEGKSWGLDLDLRSSITYHNYEYGHIFTVRILGFGFELGLLEF